MEDYKSQMQREAQDNMKLQVYIESHPELYSFFEELANATVRSNDTIRRYEDAIADVQEIEKEMEASMKEIERLKEELSKVGIQFFRFGKFAPSGYVPIRKTEGKGQYANYDYIDNAKEFIYFGQRIKNDCYIEYPIMIITEKGLITLNEIAAEDKDHNITNRGKIWYRENKELVDELKALDSEIQTIESKLELLKAPFFHKKREELEKKLAEKKALYSEKSMNAREGTAILNLLKSYNSITPEQKSIIKDYHTELIHLNQLTIKMKKAFEKVIELESIIETTIDVPELFIETALTKGKVSQEQVDKIEELLINMDLSNIEIPKERMSKQTPRGKILDMLLFSYCFDRIIPKRENQTMK